MRKAKVFVDGLEAGILNEVVFNSKYVFEYRDGYSGPAVSLTMPLSEKLREFSSFPPFFEGLLPEGFLLEGLLKFGKIDRNDFFAQLLAVGDDMVGNITVKEIQE
jgi:serine/threonine-protein kinase HipA